MLVLPFLWITPEMGVPLWHKTDDPIRHGQVWKPFRNNGILRN
ncbi:hypothetical protein GMO_17170 [Gluconobacter morbifer G707]|uniref:Uncharacterized protein n=1 Tax=Gluconobacter morbifer G707 TaxID=1088869 RepID=G6XJY8_9PROT|nr:hypothetical protein GMO_17170 [Gluconobacter morbifer G707]